MLAGLCGLCVGTYAVLDRTAPRVLALPMLAVGAAVALTGLVGAGSRVTREPLPARPVAAAGVAGAGVRRRRGEHRVVARRDLLAAYPTLDAWPTLTLTPCSWPAWPWPAGLAAPVPVRAEAPAALPAVAAR